MPDTTLRLQRIIRFPRIPPTVLGRVLVHCCLRNGGRVVHDLVPEGVGVEGEKCEVWAVLVGQLGAEGGKALVPV